MKAIIALLLFVLPAWEARAEDDWNNKVWTAMADQLRREGAVSVAAPDGTVLRKEYEGGRVVWMFTGTSGERQTCTTIPANAISWCSDFDSGARTIAILDAAESRLIGTIHPVNWESSVRRLGATTDCGAADRPETVGRRQAFPQRSLQRESAARFPATG